LEQRLRRVGQKTTELYDFAVYSLVIQSGPSSAKAMYPNPKNMRLPNVLGNILRADESI